MKHLGALGLLIVVATYFVFPRLASGHDGWVEISPTIVEKNKPRPSPSFKATTPTNTKATGSRASGIQSIRRWSLSIPKANKMP